jgi:eukaryotic-like serine/threonine-protein kinase
MDAERWSRIQTVLHHALDLPAEEREAYLEHACAGDAPLAAEVRSLLAEDASGGSILDTELARLAHDVLGREGAAPQEIGPYRVLSVLGEGGMGVVYLAEREGLGHRVAIKVLRDAALSPSRRRRFAREAQTLAHLNHPAIARLYDAAVLPDGTPYFVMEPVDGLAITTYCDRNRCSIHERLRLFRAACDAVLYAHRQAIIHRDLKPSNILVAAGPAGGDSAGIKLLDFGIAKQLDRLETVEDHTRTQLRLMTPVYAAPEQLRGEPLGVYTDVYALGVVLYQLLTDRLPFPVADLTAGQVERLTLEHDPEKPSAVAAPFASRVEAPGRAAWADLDVLCLTALQKDPQRRYPTVEALIRDIDHFLHGEPLEARPDSMPYRAGKFFRRNRRPVIAAALVAAFLVAITAFYTTRLAMARDDALAEAARTERIQRFMLGLFAGGDEAAGPADSLRVVTLIERGVSEARLLDSEPAVQAELFHTLGTIAQQMGDFERADSLLLQTLNQRRALLGPDHADVALSLLALGRLRMEQVDLDEAERLVRQSLEMSRRQLPAGHPAVADALAALGNVLQERGEYDRAATLQEEAVRLRAAQDPTSIELSVALSDLASTHFYAGRYSKSDSLNRLALAMDQRLFGRRHPFVATSLARLGATQFQLANYEEAERFYRQALAISLAYHGEDHHETAAHLLMLGQTLAFQNRLDEAMEALRPALAVRERVFGPQSPRVASVLNEMGTVALKQGEQAAAEQHYRRVVDIYRAAHGDRHYFVAVGLSNLASVYGRGQRYDLAEESINEAIELFGEALGPDHINTGIAQIKLGEVYALVERFAEAEVALRAGYETLRVQMDPSSPWLRNARVELVAIYEALGRPEEAALFQAEPTLPP